jgi:hypothetical protein
MFGKQCAGQVRGIGSAGQAARVGPFRLRAGERPRGSTRRLIRTPVRRLVRPGSKVRHSGTVTGPIPLETMTERVEEFDRWIRGSFRELNTALEESYFAQEDRTRVAEQGAPLKRQLAQEGLAHVERLLAEGNTDEGFDPGYEVLSLVGFYMAAGRRHEIAELTEKGHAPFDHASALAMQLGASLGVVPRFASCHLETHNRAIAGVYHTFTNLDDERVFIDYNTRGVLAYTRAAEALLKVLPLGVSHPVAPDLFRVAEGALRDVVSSNAALAEALDGDRFFYCVRPYYKPVRVGLHTYRGANAGDFAGINVIDLLLGVCRAEDPYYSQLLVDKFLFMRPEDQLQLRDCMRRRSLLDEFIGLLPEHDSSPWFTANVRGFLAVCDAFAETARQHHELLVSRFIERPAGRDGLLEQQDLTASGPPLPVLLRGLEKLMRLRCAEGGAGVDTRFEDIARLRALAVRGPA